MEVTSNHRPLMAGIAIKRHGAPPEASTDDEIYYGTLTAGLRIVAERRKSDLSKVPH